MYTFVAKCLAIAVPTLLILINSSLILMFVAPDGRFRGECPPPAAVLANIESRYGLDQLYWKKMFDYVVNEIFYFDFGPSSQYRDRMVNDVIAQGFPVTLTYGAQVNA